MMNILLLLYVVSLRPLVGILGASVNVTNTSILAFSNCPNDILVISDDFNEKSLVPVVWEEPSLTGGEENVQLINNISPGSRFSWGCTHVTYTGSDASGDTDCSFQICVSNTADPYLVSGNVTIQYKSCPEGNIQVDNENSDLSVEVLPEPGLDDDDAVVTDKPPDASFFFSCNKITYTGQDASGRTATCSFLVCAGKAWATPAIIVVAIFVAVASSCIACCFIVRKCCK
ncbi:hypothetical protein HOLleu_12817 [Holothuria leucospilota]|uniref:HYR domain-containing protein n=1 Tax=Holothuria leucospilota TaxID=206669 RepID=A0A9Q1CAR5_HOLLE|nr:hypothetical protein HOLleu_12817 [Holothuria leucospilota]